MTEYETEYEYDDSDFYDEEDLSWAADVATQISRLEGSFGRPLLERERNAVVADAVLAEENGHDFDVVQAIEGHYLETGREPHDLSTQEGRVRQMTERMDEGRAQEAEMYEALEDEEVEWPELKTPEERVRFLAQRMEQPAEPDSEQESDEYELVEDLEE